MTASQGNSGWSVVGNVMEGGVGRETWKLEYSEPATAIIGSLTERFPWAGALWVHLFVTEGEGEVAGMVPMRGDIWGFWDVAAEMLDGEDV